VPLFVLSPQHGDKEYLMQSSIIPLLTPVGTCISVTADRIWFYRMYWTLLHTIWNYSLQITLTQRLVLSVMVFTVQLGNIFQWRVFLCFQTHALIWWWSFHINIILIWLPSKDPPVMTASPHYITPTWTRKQQFLQCFCHTVVTYQWLFLWLHNSSFKQICHNIMDSLCMNFVSTCI
jgi:hypothetical protein